MQTRPNLRKYIFTRINSSCESTTTLHPLETSTGAAERRDSASPNRRVLLWERTWIFHAVRT